MDYLDKPDPQNEAEVIIGVLEGFITCETIGNQQTWLLEIIFILTSRHTRKQRVLNKPKED